MEDDFWTALGEIARNRSLSLNRLIAEIDAKRGGGNLSSAIRVFVLDYFRQPQGKIEKTL